MKERRKGPIIAAVVATPLLLLGVYMGSYYALLLKYRPIPGECHRIEVYYVNHPLVHTIFDPAHRIDRWLRPGHWDFQQQPPRR